ncbi:MAG: hypothetical protein IIB17_00970, partial [Chloroflexi bacterium]|nr:hypothetical protein [Chloroflexota bacterium]
MGTTLGLNAPEDLVHPFDPHLTLARIRGGASEEEGQKVAQTLSETHLDASLSIPVDSISLIRSTL